MSGTCAAVAAAAAAAAAAAVVVHRRWRNKTDQMTSNVIFFPLLQHPPAILPRYIDSSAVAWRRDSAHASP